MVIRPARPEDAPRLLALLSQVLEIHARLRPDIFVSGTTKYGPKELLGILRDPNTPVFVAVDEGNEPVGYAFCALSETPPKDNLVPRRTLYIDDLCVDEACRGQGIGEALYRFVLEEAKRRGCSSVTLAVWEGNDAARRFYEKMGMKPKETIMESVL